MISDSLKNEIIDALKPIDPEKIIVFGSHAYGQPSEDSDIDLYVVTRDNYIPRDWNEKRNLVRMVSHLIMPIRRRYAVDLIVHTLAMYNQFSTSGTSFADDVLHTGKVLV